MARLMRYQDLANATLHGPNPIALCGSLLANAKFPDVVVAKAYSHDGRGLDLVLYNAKAAGSFKLDFGRLTPGIRYSLGNGQEIVADRTGKASVDVGVNGRTALMIVPL